LGNVLNLTKECLAGILDVGLELFFDALKPLIRAAYGPLLQTISGDPSVPSELKTLIDTALRGEGEAGAALLGMVGSGLGGGLFGSIGSAIFGGWTRYANSKARQLRADIAMLQAMVRRGSIGEDQYRIGLAEIGWSDQLANAIWQITQPRPDIQTLAVDLFRRKVPIEAISGELVRRGFDPADADKIVNVLKPIPGAGDLIHMAVREAWNDEVSARYGYDEDYPAEFQEWMEKQGYDPEWSRRWWRAHWDLPGPTMARDMLHRTDMTEADYTTLLKIADYPATFRRWMCETAYEPYTRVDIRRMYQVGVIKSYAELVRAYKDIGYNDEKAGRLADFTLLEYGETEREATKTEVLNAYGIGRLSQAEATGYLKDMGYPDWVIETYIARVDLSRVNGLVKKQITHAQTMYVNGQMTKTEVYTALGRIPLTAAEIERYLEEWEISRTAKLTRPSRADLLKFFLQNTMTEADFRSELKGWRLSDRYIEWYLADAKRKLVLQAQEEKEKADAEALKVRMAAEKTETDIQIAGIAVQIASLNLTIADLKASSTPDMSLEEIEELTRMVVECQIQIKALQLQKAEIWKGYLVAKKGP